MTTYQELAADSKVWIYQANRPLTSDETQVIQQKLQQFVTGWAAHGQALKALAQVVHQRFVVLLADENQAMASGCSIDSSVHFLRDLGDELGIDFFNRTQIVYQVSQLSQTDEPIKLGSFELKELEEKYESGEVDGKTLVFNNLVKNKAELNAKWLVPLEETWLRSRLASLSK